MSTQHEAAGDPGPEGEEPWRSTGPDASGGPDASDGAGARDADDAYEAIGTVAEEAARLVAALSARSSAGQGATHTGPSCRVCPVCQGIDLLRVLSPGVVAQLAGLADAAAGVLRTLADSMERQEPHDPGTS